MKHRSLALPLAAGLALRAAAQLGGQASFSILDIPSSARIAALGGTQIAVVDNDLNLGIFNPALLNPTMGRQLSLSYLPYIDGINVGYASYGQHFDSLGLTFSGTVQFVDYGTFTQRDETGAETGTFTAGEHVVQFGAGRTIDSLFSVGANVKYIGSQLGPVSANAVAVDVGGTFHKRSAGLTVSAMVRNLGTTLSSYTDEEEKLPLNVQLGVTYKFKHAPFRLGLMLNDLQQWDLTYEDPNDVQIDPTTGDPIVDKVTTLEKGLMHVVPNVEILLSQNFMLRAGYDYRRRQELAIPGKPGLTGLSFGVGLRVSKVHLSYGFAQFNPAGASNTITLALRFADLKPKGAAAPAPPPEAPGEGNAR
jgi:hypothetical protein